MSPIEGEEGKDRGEGEASDAADDAIDTDADASLSPSWPSEEPPVGRELRGLWSSTISSVCCSRVSSETGC
jgi:hypothetical protein